MSPQQMEEVEQEKLDKIQTLSISLLELKKNLTNLENEKKIHLQEKCSMLKKMRKDEFSRKATDIDEKERELSRITKQLVDELINSCEETPFNKALINVLSNLRGIIIYSFLKLEPDKQFHYFGALKSSTT